MHDVLTPHQRAVAERVLDEEGGRRRHLVVSLSGAHAYGFASPDSDLDLKAIHVAPTRALLGLHPASTETERMEVLDGVEIDYTSNELAGALRGILKGNGNYIERILGHLQPRGSAELEALKPLVAASLSRRAFHHYRGFSSSQLQEFERGGARSAKRLLYVLRTALTGAHLLISGRLITDVTLLLDEHGFREAQELLDIKKSGEKAGIAVEDAPRWRVVAQRAFQVLDDALARSPLPEAPPNADALDAWLVELRRSAWV
jgi:predicted nucleotidyltransferase